MDKQQLLTKLAPFLPYGVIIRNNHLGIDAKLAGLRDFEYRYAVEPDSSHWSKRKINGDLLATYEKYSFWNIDDCTPHLRPFSSLTATILHEGKEVVPAIEIAKLAVGNKDAVFKVCSFGDLIEVRRGIEGLTDVEIEKGFNVYRLSNARYEHVCNQVAIIDLLRAMHFAVDFEESEYIPKT